MEHLTPEQLFAEINRIKAEMQTTTCCVDHAAQAAMLLAAAVILSVQPHPQRAATALRKLCKAVCEDVELRRFRLETKQ
jgi:ABC-type nitrate/sulfonate/bicarbonate transport system ATPase subunit